MTNAAVIGNGRMAIECVRILRESGAAVALVVSEPAGTSAGDSLAAFCREESIACLETSALHAPETIERVRAAAPAFIFSINSFRVIREPLLSLPPGGFLNFHNGPLPRYRGMNACSWAIFNGETNHGVTWHFMNADVDAGDIVGQRIFSIRPRETAATLVLKCLSEGVSLFRDVAPSVLRGGAPRVRQDEGAATRYFSRDVPNGGWVDFRWPYEPFDRFLRSLRLHPLPHPFARPAATANGRTFFLESAVKWSDAGGADAGCVLSVGPDGVDVQLADAVLRITRVLDAEGEDLVPRQFVERYGVTPGMHLGPR